MTKDQNNFSSAYNQMYDVNVRKNKSKKAISIIDDYLNETVDLTILDIGCSTGIMTNEYSKKFKKSVGIDIDLKAIEYAKQEYENEHLKFFQYSFDDKRLNGMKFDVITCSHIYEHVEDPYSLFENIYKLLKPGGICYFVAGNRYKIIEPHFKLPFLSFFPKNIGKIYVKIMGKSGEFYQKHLSVSNLKKIVSQFVIHDYTIETIKNPVKYYSEDIVKQGSAVQKIYIFLSKFFYFFIPTYIWILEKSINEDY